MKNKIWDILNKKINWWMVILIYIFVASLIMLIELLIV
jgi:hypothetical protein